MSMSNTQYHISKINYWIARIKQQPQKRNYAEAKIRYSISKLVYNLNGDTQTVIKLLKSNGIQQLSPTMIANIK